LDTFGFNGECFPPLLQDAEKNPEDKHKALVLRKAIADVFTRCGYAEFTRRDMELLVLLAMQVGRLPTRRLIEYAAQKGIIISEDEVGVLNMRWRDVDQLDALHCAAKATNAKITYHLQALKAELDFAKREEIFRARVGEILDPPGAIREVRVRTKQYVSLVRKLVRKQRHFDELPSTCEVSLTAFCPRVEAYDHHSEMRCIVRGDARMFMHRAEVGSGFVDIGLALGTEGGPQIKAGYKNLPAAFQSSQRVQSIDAPLVARILDDGVYHIDDLTGARILTNYQSDIDDVLDEIRRRHRDWGAELGKIDDLSGARTVGIGQSM